jgi:hypothetical protein
LLPTGNEPRHYAHSFKNERVELLLKEGRKLVCADVGREKRIANADYVLFENWSLKAAFLSFSKKNWNWILVWACNINLTITAGSHLDDQHSILVHFLSYVSNISNLISKFLFFRCSKQPADVIACVAA